MADAELRETVRIEQVKLGATYLNGIAIALFAVGGLAPFVSIVLNPPAAPRTATYLVVAGVSVAFVVVSMIVHLAALSTLEDIKP